MSVIMPMLCEGTAIPSWMDMDSLPTLEASRMKIFHLLEDKEVDICDVEGVIERDPAMAAKVIQLANSAFYRRTSKGVGLHDSILSIGIGMVKCITLSMTVMRSLGALNSVARELWTHSYEVAMLASGAGKGRDEENWLFSGGLLHDLGRLILVALRPEAYLPLFGDHGELPAIEQERDLFLLDHAELGYMVAQRWDFPEQICGIIRNHHQPADYLSAVVWVADQIAHQYLCRDNALYDKVFCLLGTDNKRLVDNMEHRYHRIKILARDLAGVA
ncbi:MAG: HDOD domain-containing protein [Thermodesulfobacteriota bacterium]|nr:HDOD domain-containing protein [Thermodesulfobacteriota bacterium]